jgi:hypothetical protein
MKEQKMLNLIIATFTATALLGSSMMIGAAEPTPEAGKHFTGHIHQPGHWWAGAGWHRFGPWGWRHRWTDAKHAKDRVESMHQ